MKRQARITLVDLYPIDANPTEDSMIAGVIRANDEMAGEIIEIRIIPAGYDGEQGYRLAASNGDDIGHYRPQSADKCRADMRAQYGNWATFEEI